MTWSELTLFVKSTDFYKAMNEMIESNIAYLRVLGKSLDDPDSIQGHVVEYTAHRAPRTICKNEE